MRLPKQAMKRTFGVLTAVVALTSITSIPAVAEAQDQPWLRDRRYTEGIGYRVGDFELHPGVAAEFGYDSNYFHRDAYDTASNTPPVGSLRLRITPSFSLSTIGAARREVTAGTPPPDVEFRGGISATYNEFFPVSGPPGDFDLMRRQRTIGGNIDLALDILPRRPWSGSVYGSLMRSITAPQEGAVTSEFIRLLPRAGAELIWTPGGGLLDWRIGYQFSGTFFESSRFTSLNNIQNQIQTRGRWRFLPRTALLYDARFGFITYMNPAPGGKNGSHPLRTQIGINGLITPSFSLLALVGWGASFYETATPEDFNSVIGQAELKWYITPNPSNDPSAAGLALSTLTVGFIRDFYDSFIGTYAERDRGYANLSYFFGGRFLVMLEGGAGPVIHPAIPTLDLKSFTDIRVDAALFGEYRLVNAFGINTTLRYGQNISSTRAPVVQGIGGPDSLAWQQFEAYLGVRWLM